MKSEPKPQILTKEIIEIPNEVNDYQRSFKTPQEPTTPQEGGGGVHTAWTLARRG